MNNYPRQSGQAMIEYVVICVAVGTALGIGMVDDQSVLWQLIHEFQKAYARFGFAISLPT